MTTRWPLICQRCVIYIRRNQFLWKFSCSLARHSSTLCWGNCFYRLSQCLAIFLFALSVYLKMMWRNNPLPDNSLLKHVSRQRTRLEELKALPRINTRFRDNGFLKNSNGTFGHGDFYEGRVRVIKDSGFVNSSEAGSNISTVALRVVGGDEKGSLKTETVKYSRKSHGTWTLEWLPWRGPAAIVNDRPVLSSEIALHIKNSHCLTVIKIWS
jgi:hypothetical protein